LALKLVQRKRGHLAVLRVDVLGSELLANRLAARVLQAHLGGEADATLGLLLVEVHFKFWHGRRRSVGVGGGGLVVVVAVTMVVMVLVGNEISVAVVVELGLLMLMLMLMLCVLHVHVAVVVKASLRSLGREGICLLHLTGEVLAVVICLGLVGVESARNENLAGGGETVEGG